MHGRAAVRAAARSVALTLVAVGVLLGAAACDALPLPDRSDLPSIALPVPAPTRGGDGGSATDGIGESAPPVSSIPEGSESTPGPEIIVGPNGPAASEVAPDEQGARITWWPFLIALVLGCGALFALGARTRAQRDWQRRLDAAHDDLRWLEDALVPAVLEKPTAAAALSTWQAAGPRVLRLDEDLYAAQATQPDSDRADGVAADLLALRALVKAVDAETATLGASGADDLRSHRSMVEQARADVRRRLRGA